MSYVLFADDHEATRHMVRDVLGTVGHEVALAPDGAAALRAIEAREPDLLILDRNMPGASGIEVCRTVKRNPFTARIPILMLTARGEVEQRVEGLEAGADDYLAKPFDPRELRARVQALLRLVRREADRNPTTGLPGSRAIAEELERRSAAGEPFALCYLDIDHFKPFAETFGFAAADVVIERLGAALRGAVREVGEVGEDFVGHIGGDDFLVVTKPGRAESLARASASRFREAVESVVGHEAMAAGEFSGVDRDGSVKRFPIARLTAAVLSVAPGHWVSSQHVGTLAADVKRRARLRGAGTILVETV